MKNLLLALSAVVLFVGAAPLTANEPLVVGWENLLPEERVYDDPFLELPYAQINDLATLYRIEVLNVTEITDAKRAEAAEIRERLVSAGLDPDQLFEQRKVVMYERRLADTEPNPDLIGQTIKIPGYLLPLEMVDEKAVEFLLVPTIGACIHTPTPPANQMVFVRFEQGFAVDGLYTPIWVSGALQAQNRTQSLHLVDGQANVETTYIVQAETVEAYQ